MVFANNVGFPVLVRPSFVLSGAAMSVASNEEELHNCLASARDLSPDKPIVMSKYYLNAKEIEFDGVAKGGQILNYAISEHVENAGVHSGDATLVLPAQKLYVQTVRVIKHIAAQVATALNITGPFNMQLLARDNQIKVIECNLRASRTFPFISKTFDADFIKLATTAMLGHIVKPYQISLYDYDYVAVKAPIFSFTRLRGVSLGFKSLFSILLASYLMRSGALDISSVRLSYLVIALASHMTITLISTLKHSNIHIYFVRLILHLALR